MLLLISISPVTSALAKAEVSSSAVLEVVEKQAPLIEEVGLKLWDLAELSLLKVKSAKYLKKVLKKNGLKITSDTDFLAQVRKDFEKRTEGFEYKSPINAMIKEPVGLPAEMRSHGSIMELKESFHKQAGDDQFLPQKKNRTFRQHTKSITPLGN